MVGIKTACLRDISILPKNSFKVVIMRYFPFWMRGIRKKYDIYAPELAPSSDLLKDLKDAQKRTGMPTAWYMIHFPLRFRHEVLNREKALDLMRKLKRIAKKKDVYLICKEVDAEYCHRTIVKELMDQFDLGD